MISIFLYLCCVAVCQSFLMEKVTVRLAELTKTAEAISSDNTQNNRTISDVRCLSLSLSLNVLRPSSVWLIVITHWETIRRRLTITSRPSNSVAIINWTEIMPNAVSWSSSLALTPCHDLFVRLELHIIDQVESFKRRDFLVML